MNPQTNTVYVDSANENAVVVIDGRTNSVVATVGVGSNPHGVAVNLRTNAVYVANQWPVVLAWGLWALTLLALPVVNWLDQRLRQAGLPELAILEPPPSRWSRRN